jgi:hypothetical protein
MWTDPETFARSKSRLPLQIVSFLLENANHQTNRSNEGEPSRSERSKAEWALTRFPLYLSGWEKANAGESQDWSETFTISNAFKNLLSISEIEGTSTADEQCHTNRPIFRPAKWSWKKFARLGGSWSRFRCSNHISIRESHTNSRFAKAHVVRSLV